MKLLAYIMAIFAFIVLNSLQLEGLAWAVLVMLILLDGITWLAETWLYIQKGIVIRNYISKELEKFMASERTKYDLPEREPEKPFTTKLVDKGPTHVDFDVINKSKK